MMTPAEFIAHWRDSAGAELGNSQSFLKELCTLLDVPQPEPNRADDDRNQYVFEKTVAFNNGDGATSPGRIDFYRKGGFVLESKQGSERKAKEQEEALAFLAKQSQKKSRHGTAVHGAPSGCRNANHAWHTQWCSRIRTDAAEQAIELCRL